MRALRDHAAGRWLLVALALLACAFGAAAEEKLPPYPAAYFNDYAGVVDAATVQTLDEQLRQFERDTSNQILVAVFRKMESESSLFDYTFRIAQSWKVGQKDKDNGAVLFVFVDDRKMFIQVGYGLEGALPDAICKRIVDEEIRPRFRTSNFADGLKAGVEAMIKATRGEYKGTGRVAGDGRYQRDNSSTIILAIFGGLFLFQIIRFFASGTQYSGRGRRRDSSWWGPMGGFGGGGSAGGWSSGGGGDSGGGFSGGGGSFGGGGAGGDW